MRFQIRPRVGAGPVKLGVSREEVRSLLEKEFGVSPDDSRGGNDNYRGLGFFVRYDWEGKACCISFNVSEKVDCIFEGVDVFDVPADELLRHIEQFDTAAPELGLPNWEYTFPNLILRLLHPDPQYDHKRGQKRPVFCAVEIGNADYLRVHRHQPFERRYAKKWSADPEPAPSQREACEALRALGAWMGLDEDGNVRRVSMMDSPFNEKPLTVVEGDLARLKVMSMLEAVDVRSVEISDVGLGHLGELPGLKALEVKRVAGTILNRLAELTGLEELVVRSPAQACKYLRAPTKLRKLAVLPDGDARFTLETLADLVVLEYLELRCTRMSDADLAHVRGLPCLKDLRLRLDVFTDEGLAHVGELANLESLDLKCPQVTDTGVEHLAGLANLELLYLRSMQITPDGARRLRESLPELVIHMSEGWRHGR